MGIGIQEGSPPAVSGEAIVGSTKTLFFYDDFADTNPKVIGTDAVVGEISNDSGTEGTVMPFSGSKMLLVDNVGATDGTVYYQFGKFSDQKIGIKVRWWKNADVAAFEIILQHYDKTTVETYKVKFLESGMNWQYHNSAGSYADITGGAEDIADNTWNEAYLTIDLTALTYGQLVTNGISVDLSSISAQTAADAVTEGSSKITFGITTGANNKATYMDEFNIYLNEP